MADIVQEIQEEVSEEISENTLLKEGAKKTLSQKLADEAKKRVRELADKATDPSTYVDAVTGKVKKIAGQVKDKVKQGKSLKPRKK